VPGRKANAHGSSKAATSAITKGRPSGPVGIGVGGGAFVVTPGVPGAAGDAAGAEQPASRAAAAARTPVRTLNLRGPRMSRR